MRHSFLDITLRCVPQALAGGRQAEVAQWHAGIHGARGHHAGVWAGGRPVECGHAALPAPHRHLPFLGLRPKHLPAAGKAGSIIIVIRRSHSLQAFPCPTCTPPLPLGASCQELSTFSSFCGTTLQTNVVGGTIVCLMGSSILYQARICSMYALSGS